MSPSTFTSLRSDPVSQAYYQHKRDPRQSALDQAAPSWPTAARHTTQGHPKKTQRTRNSKHQMRFPVRFVRIVMSDACKARSRRSTN